MNTCGCHSGNHKVNSIGCYRFVERLETYGNTIITGFCILIKMERSKICHTIIDRDYRQRRSKIQADSLKDLEEETNLPQQSW